MRYPIDIETYMKALRLEFGPVSECREEAYRKAVQLVNACYEDGLRGESGYPLELGEELQVFSEASGSDPDHIKKNPLLPPLIAWCNRAYAQGRKEAAE